MLNNLMKPHEYPGKLFVVEGIDGSGKTTQLTLLAKWLSAEGHRVFVTEWNSSALAKAATKRTPAKGSAAEESAAEPRSGARKSTSKAATESVPRRKVKRA